MKSLKKGNKPMGPLILNFTEKMRFRDRIFWNQRSYGSALRLKRGHLIVIGAILCLCTPGTNWMIFWLRKWIKQDVVMRYDVS